MSVRVLSKVWEFYPAGGSELLTLLALADWSDDEGFSYPSIASMAKKTRLSSSQARRNLHFLINNNYVHVIGNKNGGAKGSTRLYKINLMYLTTGSSATPALEARASTDVRDDLHRYTVTTSNHASQTVIEPSITTKGFVLPDWVPVIEWNAFVDHRKKLKKPLTEYSMKLAIIKLKEIIDTGHKADDIINETILRGWQSFFAPKGNESHNSDVMDGVL